MSKSRHNRMYPKPSASQNLLILCWALSVALATWLAFEVFNGSIAALMPVGLFAMWMEFSCEAADRRLARTREQRVSGQVGGGRGK